MVSMGTSKLQVSVGTGKVDEHVAVRLVSDKEEEGHWSAEDYANAEEGLVAWFPWSHGWSSASCYVVEENVVRHGGVPSLVEVHSKS